MTNLTPEQLAARGNLIRQIVKARSNQSHAVEPVHMSGRLDLSYRIGNQTFPEALLERLICTLTENPSLKEEERKFLIAAKNAIGNKALQNYHVVRLSKYLPLLINLRDGPERIVMGGGRREELSLVKRILFYGLGYDIKTRHFPDITPDHIWQMKRRYSKNGKVNLLLLAEELESQRAKTRRYSKLGRVDYENPASILQIFLSKIDPETHYFLPGRPFIAFAKPKFS